MRWFKHFADTRRNPKVRAIERGLGEAGYARAIKLLEVVAQNCGAGEKFKPRLDLRKPITNETWLAEELGVEVKALEETLKIFSAVGFIDTKAFEHRVISIPQMLEYRDEWSARSSRATHEQLPSDSGLTPPRVRGKSQRSDSDSEVEAEKESHSSDSAHVTRCASEFADPFVYCCLHKSKMATAVSKKQWLRFEPRFNELFKSYTERVSHLDGECTCGVDDFLEDAMQVLKDEGVRWPKAVLARKKEIEEQAKAKAPIRA